MTKKKKTTKQVIKDNTAVKKPSARCLPPLVSTRIGIEGIDRIWAHLGQVWARTREGIEKSWSPVEAARIAQTLGNMAISEGFSNLECKQLMQLRDMTCEAIREALHQREAPKDSTTAAVTRAIHDSNMLTVDDDDMKRRLVRLCPMFTTLQEDEIRDVIQSFPGKSDSWYEGFLQDRENDRLRYYQQKSIGVNAVSNFHPSAEKVDF